MFSFRITRPLFVAILFAVAIRVMAQSFGNSLRSEIRQDLGETYAKYIFITTPVSGIEPGDVLIGSHGKTSLGIRSRRLSWYQSALLRSFEGWTGRIPAEDLIKLKCQNEYRFGGYRGTRASAKQRGIDLVAILRDIAGVNASSSQADSALIAYSWERGTVRNLELGSLSSVEKLASKYGGGLADSLDLDKNYWLLTNTVEVVGLSIELQFQGAGTAGLQAELDARANPLVGSTPEVKSGFKLERRGSGSYSLKFDGPVVVAVDAEFLSRDALKMRLGLLRG